MYCGYLHRYNKPLTLLEPTDNELRNIPEQLKRDQTCARITDEWRKIKCQ